jgi:Domain of unknown function (DUF2935)
MSRTEERNNPSAPRGCVTRREILLAGGAGLVGLTVRGDALASVLAGMASQEVKFPGVTTVSGAKKPVFVPAMGSTDPVAHSLAESLFWLDQEFEHTKFFIMHMPSPDLDTQRAQVMQFQNDFNARLNAVRSGGADRANLAAFNRPTIELVRRFLDAKRMMEKEQEAGRLKSLAWPTFFEHVALEGERFANRLEKFSQGRVEMDRSEVVNFWSRIMADHADFIAHLLDPEEKALVQKAMQTSTAWRGLKGGSKGKVDDTLDSFIAFKKTAGAGVESGQIKSIIHPLLADHVLREALKFSDELKRVS